MKEFVDIHPSLLVDPDQTGEVRSPLLDSLSLDAGRAALFRTVEAWHMLGAFERRNDSSRSVLDEVLEDYLRAPQSIVGPKSGVFWYVHEPTLVGQAQYFKPTHFKQRLATSSSQPRSLYGNKDMGYRLLQHEYHPENALEGDLASLAQGNFYWKGITDPYYVFRPHNHGQSFVSYFRRGGMRITEWRFPGGEVPNELCNSTEKVD